MNVSTATAAELVAFYNAHSDKPVARFSDRKTAERRVAALLAALPAEQPALPAEQPALPAEQPALPDAGYVRGTCPICGATEDITCGRVVELRGLQHVVDEHHAVCHGCGHEFNYDTGVVIRPRKPAVSGKDRSAAIAASWKDAAVAERRAQRHAVRVTDPRGGSGEYPSVRTAFLMLALPLSKHIRFRGQLKAAGSAEFAGYKFVVVTE